MTKQLNKVKGEALEVPRKITNREFFLKLGLSKSFIEKNMTVEIYNSEISVPDQKILIEQAYLNLLNAVARKFKKIQKQYGLSQTTYWDMNLDYLDYLEKELRAENER